MKITTILAIFALVVSALPFNVPAIADPAPDYNITELSVAPANMQERGLNLTVSVKVKNIGDALGKTISLRFKAGTTLLGNKVLNNISAGNEIPTHVTWTVPCTFDLGKVDLNVSIDGTKVQKILTYTIIEQSPVITVEFAKGNLSYVPNYAVHKDPGKTGTLKIAITLTNKGCAAVANVTVVLKNQNGKELGKATGVTILAHQSINLTIPIKLKAGTSAKLTAVATYGGGLIATSPMASSPHATVSANRPCGDLFILAAVVVPMVVLIRRKK